MGLRFRKSISLGKGVKMNIGKSGVGFSAGIKGARIGVNSRGTYTSTSIPGTGISSVNYVKSSNNSNDINTDSADVSPIATAVTIFIVIDLIIFIISSLMGWIVLLIGIAAYYSWTKTPEQQAIKKLKNAREFFNQKEFIKAIELLKEANKLDGKNSDVIYLLGASYHNIEKYKDAISWLDKYVKTTGGDEDVLMLVANCHYHTKEYKKAISILQKINNADPENLKAIQLLGACFASQNEFGMAIDVFKKAPLQKRKLDDDLMEVHYNLAMIYKDSGDTKNALKHFKKVYANDIEYRDVEEQIESLEN